MKNKWNQTNTPPICLHDMYRDGFTSTLPTGSVKEEFSLVLSKTYITNCSNWVTLNLCCRIYCYVRLYMLLLTPSVAFSLVFIDIVYIYIITNHMLRFWIKQLVQIPSEIFRNWLTSASRALYKLNTITLYILVSSSIARTSKSPFFTVMWSSTSFGEIGTFTNKNTYIYVGCVDRNMILIYNQEMWSRPNPILWCMFIEAKYMGISAIIFKRINSSLLFLSPTNISSTIAEIYIQFFEKLFIKHWIESGDISYYKR